MARGIKELLTNSNSFVEDDRREMWLSLMETIIFVGGDDKAFHNTILHANMTVVELIDSLAQNGVRFTVKGL